MEVVVEEDCNKTVAKIPIINPATGLASSPKSSPAVQPPRTLAPLPSNSNPKRKKYKKKQTMTSPKKAMAHSSPVWTQQAEHTSPQVASPISAASSTVKSTSPMWTDPVGRSLREGPSFLISS